MSTRSRKIVMAGAAALALLAAQAAAAAAPIPEPTDDALAQQFRAPGADARPRVWWHWIDGNVTQDGITRDLEWMQRIGVAGFQLFDVGRGYPALVDEPAAFMSPQWLRLVRHAAAEADRLGLEMTLASSGGWSETGGPSVQPASAMKKLVWSETDLRGGQRFSGKLPQPPSANGPFQDVAMQSAFKIGGEPKWDQPAPDTPYYADARVIAYRQAVGDPPKARATASAGTPDAALLRDGRFDRAFVLPVAPSQGDQPGENWLALDFGAPVTVRSLRLGILWPQGTGSAMPGGSVQVTDDGKTWHTLAPLPDPGSAAGLPVYTMALPETRARHFRVLVQPSKGFSLPGLPVRSIEEFRFTELDFSAVARPNRYEAKAGYATLHDYESAATPATTAAIDPASVVDLTSRLRADGTLDWTPPPGHWKVLRFGYSLTGAINRPATAAGSGYEVDKYSAHDVRAYLDAHYGPVFAALGPLVGARGLRAVLTDSWEAGQANWTPAMIEEFRARRGYDPTPYLPVLADQIVGSAEASDRFLWDFRRTLADLLAEAHYKTVADFAREHGLAYYGEAMGIGLPTTGDGLQDKRYPTVPMAEFWQVPPSQPSWPNHIADVREAASAAHVYGQNIVATESFTSFPFPGMPTPYATTPWLLKPLADRFMALGVNRFVIHTAPHQPLEQGPGFTLSMVGQYFSRHETWGEHARGWMDYLARSSQLLQAGRYAADIAYFYGEGAAVTVPDGAVTDPAIPAGYAYDFVGRDMLLQDFRVQDGRLVAPSGVSYRLLLLPSSTTSLSLPLARKLRDL
ncbi:MAG: glycosyl hydrolase, partial [Solimonas sp.]